MDIYINDASRTGKDACEAAPLFLEELMKLPEEVQRVRLVASGFWGWAECADSMRRHIIDALVEELIKAVGNQFRFAYSYRHETRELGVIAQRC